MIDRSYLPYKVAREYVDRGMAKWMSFFISEHTTALTKLKNESSFSEEMVPEEKMIIIYQMYQHGVTILLFTSDRKEPYIGTICDIDCEKIYFRTDDKTRSFLFSQILRLDIAEEDNG